MAFELGHFGASEWVVYPHGVVAAPTDDPLAVELNAGDPLLMALQGPQQSTVLGIPDFDEPIA
jgi:hypothetical protein